mgnify:FL=1
MEKCTETKDVRVGLYLMRETGNLAEERSSRKITTAQVAEAIKKVDDFHIKPKEGLDEELRAILDLVKEHSGKKIGEIFALYAERGGDLSYKSFQRRVTKLKEGKFVNAERSVSEEGNTTLVHYDAHRKLTEF